MAGETILIVDDEADIRELLDYNLKKDGYKTMHAATGHLALKCARDTQPAAIILDVLLPEIDGFEVCKILKNDPSTRGIPVIMLTAKSEDIDIVAGLELGADDYVTKPFSPRVLIARLRRLLRKSREPVSDDSRISLHNLVIDTNRFEVRVDGENVRLTASQFEILRLLAQRPGWVLSREKIINGLKGYNYAITERTVDVQIAGMRKKLGHAGNLIETVRGVGYRLKP